MDHITSIEIEETVIKHLPQKKEPMTSRLQTFYQTLKGLTSILKLLKNNQMEEHYHLYDGIIPVIPKQVRML
jgi:hypothetical protein